MTGRPVALVTGAARGIGRAAALALAGRGYDVVINYSVSEAAAEQVAQEGGRPGHERHERPDAARPAWEGLIGIIVETG